MFLLCILLLCCVNVQTTTGNDKKNGLKDLLRKKGISVLHQNVRGLLNNFIAIEELISSNKNIDVLTLSETHICSSEDNEKLYSVPNYNFESRNRSKGTGGGVAVYVRKDIDYVRRIDLENDSLENIVIEIIINKSKNFLIATHYRPPNTSKYLCKNFKEEFDKSLSLYCSESKELILLGDMNVDYQKQNDNKDIKSIIQVNGLTQIIKKPTRVTKDSKTLIDIIATNNPANIVTSDVIATAISDHDMVACVRKINNKRFPKKVTKCRNYRVYDPGEMRRDFQNVNWNPVLTAINANDALLVPIHTKRSYQII